MPWQLEAMKDVVGHERLRGAVKHALIRRYPNGETHPVYWVPCTEYIGVRGERGELKHLSTPQEKKSTEIPKVAASEMGLALKLQWI